MLQKNEYTVFFAWPTWCIGSVNTFKNYVMPYIESGGIDNIGIVLMYYGNKTDLDTIYKYKDNKLKIFVTDSNGGLLDKNNINNKFRDLFKNYKKINYVPVTIVCDKDLIY